MNLKSRHGSKTVLMRIGVTQRTCYNAHSYSHGTGAKVNLWTPQVTGAWIKGDSAIEK